MTAKEERLKAERRLLEGFQIYDQAVDVVSIFEWLHTDSGVEGVPATVQHFERFPTLRAPDGKQATPDFTILFLNGAALIGEVARFARRDESVDRLCAQLLRYDTLGGAKDGRGRLVDAPVDVVFLVDVELGMAALQRILEERYSDPNHFYKPSRPPVIIQYARSPERYVFQRLPHEKNGVIRDEGRNPSVGAYLSRQGLNVRPTNFIPTKAARAFINDSVDPLYLATHLWAKTLPTMLGGPSGLNVILLEGDLANALKNEYGHGRVSDVRNALQLLERAGLARPGDQGGTWEIAWRQLRTTKGRDTHETLAARASGISRVPRAIPARTTIPAESEQLSLL